MDFNDLVKKEPRLEIIMDSLLDGVLTIEHGDTFTFANAGAAKIFMASKEELKKRKFGTTKWAFLAEDGTPLTGEDEPFAIVRRENSTISAKKVLVQRPDGSQLPVLLNIGPINIEGMERGMVGVLTDISSLEESEKLRSHYQQAISHDLRSPLTVIMGYTDMLRMKLEDLKPPDEVWAALDAVEQAGNRMLIMLNDLLEIAQLEHAQINLERSSINLKVFLPVLLAEWMNFDGSNRFTLRIQPDLPVIEADQSKLTRVLSNLLENAVHYSEKNSPILIEAAATAEFVRISIQDHGQGFEPDTILSLFNRFNRGESQEKTGFGLGLFIVKQLTEAHGGHIFVCSKPGGGATFSVYFPCKA